MICDNCGLSSQDDFKFCPRCGAILVKRMKVDKSKMIGTRQEIMNAIGERKATDEIVTPVWIYIMIVFYIAQFATAVAIGFSIAGDVLRAGEEFSEEIVFDEMKSDLWLPVALSVIFYGLGSILAYVLVSRQNKHFTRDARLRKGVLSMFASLSDTPDAARSIEGELSRLNQIDDMMNAHEKKRVPFVWALAIALPLIVSAVQWVLIMSGEEYSDYQRTSLLFTLLNLAAYIPLFDLSYFLGKTIFSHHENMGNFADETSTGLKKLGFKENRPYTSLTLIHKSYALFIFVSIISLGLFMFYWWYTLVDDPNRHMNSQWSFEDSLLEMIRD